MTYLRDISHDAAAREFRLKRALENRSENAAALIAAAVATDQHDRLRDVFGGREARGTRLIASQLCLLFRRQAVMHGMQCACLEIRGHKIVEGLRCMRDLHRFKRRK
jgi:hypothetical protein